MAEEPCAPLRIGLADLQAALDDAEVDRASALADQVLASISCQPAVVDPSELLELHRLDALAALAKGDEEDAVVATLRAVVLAGEAGRPEARYGPELARLYETWLSRLGRQQVVVELAPGLVAWLDGEPLADGADPFVAGEHLLQVRQADGRLVNAWVELREARVELSLDQAGQPQFLPLPAVVEGPAPVPEPAPPPDPDPPAERRRGVAWWVAGGVLGAGSLTSLVLARRAEARFQDDPFLAERYGDCVQGSSCYRAARAEALQAQAGKVNLGYGLGYGLLSLSVGAFGVGLAVDF